ncbi:MAG: hypothetical protein L3J67_11100 [Hyphomicrobiaceae bacterium]|nr:hypothetical protein [Hyphomicrobiaceae bacterium]
MAGVKCFVENRRQDQYTSVFILYIMFFWLKSCTENGNFLKKLIYFFKKGNIMKIDLSKTFVFCAVCFVSGGLANTVTASQGIAAEPPMTAEEKAEKAHRRGCKIKICNAFINKKMSGSDISCDVTKTWRKSRIEAKYLKNKVSWPWGKARCDVSINMKHDELVKAAAEAAYETALPKQAVSCDLFQQSGDGKYKMSFSVMPKVKWKDGKAVEVALNMSDIEGSALAKGGLWTISKFNSLFGTTDSSIMEKINEWIVNDCNEVKSELPK